ncbi:acyltransferase family protein [Paenibacillus sp. TRM 82003]|uniref:acyltransferase family protein n=1 Tax=Kineococcus sp. TRM81007 TaxID=2925831 RepID=UPI001F5A3F44|nr:acyltransferase family protein [Kineococcus sp. TRM81007]MCI2238436.1 acyltransferase family protein [Kineococcus sp. TRM81007]MCI3922050.1 acyltransferase family protein [Paenibacillus sp. TRM 82003]
MTARTAAPATSRQEWADAAKGASVALVVLGHVTWFHYLPVVERAWPGASGAQWLWSMFNEVLRPLRMPLFFAVAGYFAVRALQRPWSSVLRPRVGTYAYLHVVWLLLWTLTGLAVGAVAGGGLEAGSLGLVVPADPAGWLTAGLAGGVGPWFLYALALYFTIGKLTARLPRAVVVAAAAAVATASFATWLPAPWGSESVLQNGVWYFLGAACAGRLRELAARPRPLWAAVAAAGLLGAGVLLWRLDPGVVGQAVAELPLRLLAVTTGVLLAVQLTTSLPRLAAPWVRLGRRTLPVYVLHPVLLFVLHPVLLVLDERLLSALPGPLPQAAALLYPPLLSAALVLASVGVHALLLRAGAAWLFALPGGPRPAQLPPAPVPAQPAQQTRPDQRTRPAPQAAEPAAVRPPEGGPTR